MTDRDVCRHGNTPLRTASDAEVKDLLGIDPIVDDGNLRQFDTGATRDTAEDKLEPWGLPGLPPCTRYQ